MPDTAPAIDPAHTALLVMDYRNAIVGRIGEPEALLARVAAAIGIVRRRGGQVGYVRVAFDDADFAAIPAHSRFAAVVSRTGRDTQRRPGTDTVPHPSPAAQEVSWR